MRVISGVAGGRSLVAPGGPTRPTSDLLRETLFNMLAVEGPFERVADLFAGSGALGIEALSRGAAFAVFVDRDARACRAIQRNLEATGLATSAQVICAALPAAFSRLSGTYDLAMLDPPYAANDLPAILGALAAARRLRSGALVVAEHRCTTGLPAVIGPLRHWKGRRQGDAALTIYRYQPEGGLTVP